MSESRRHRLLRNTFLAMGTWILPILPSLIATPILIRRLGNENYGLYVGVISLISYFFTGGVGRVAAKYVAEYTASKRPELISQIISATLILSQGVGFLCVAILVLTSRYLIADVLHIPPTQQHEATTALYLACAIILTTTLGQIFQSAVQGTQRFGSLLILTNVSSALLNFGSIAVVLLGYGVGGLFVWMLVVNSLTAVAFYILARRYVPEFRLTLTIGRDTWRIVSVYAASIIFHQIFGNALFLFERGWILRTFGSEVLAFYAVAMTLAMYIQMFASNLVVASFPALNELLTEPEKLLRLYRNSTKYVLAFVVFAVVSLLIAGRAFLAVWVGADFADGAAIFLAIHAITFGIVALNTVIWQVNESYGAAAVNAFATFLWMALSIPLMIVLASSYSSSGVAGARLIGVLVFVPFLFWSETKHLGSQITTLWIPALWRVALAGAVAGLIEFAILSFSGASWPSIVMALAAGGAVFIGALFVCRSFDDEELHFFRSVVTRES